MERLNTLLANLVLTVVFLFPVSCNSCQSQKNAGKEMVVQTYTKVSPDFNADSAYHFVERQVSFGPRVPGTVAHEACGDYLFDSMQISLIH